MEDIRDHLEQIRYRTFIVAIGIILLMCIEWMKLHIPTEHNKSIEAKLDSLIEIYEIRSYENF